MAAHQHVTARPERPAEALARLYDEQLRRKCERDLVTFIRQAWPILEPGTPFVPNWHIDLLAEHLEAVTAGDITRLVINMPPRYGKSIIVSVMWPVWEWIRHPETRWMFASYTATLSTDHSMARRRLIESDWYRARWGHVYTLTSDQNVKTEYENSRRGRMFSTSFTGSATGKGGGRLVIDDPSDPRRALSDTEREAALTAFQQTFSTRLDDKKTGAIVLVMQRLHHQDLTAHCLAQGYVHVKLDNPCAQRTTVVFPRSGRTLVREAGDLLWPAREGPEEVAAVKRALGSYAFAGQYQQNPSPLGGGVFKREWWQFYRELPAESDEWVMSWDCAFKGADDSDLVAGQVWMRKGATKYLVARVAERLGFGATLQAIRHLRARYPQVSRVYIEDTANGPAIIETLRQEIPGIVPVTPEGGKVARAFAVSADVEAGNVRLPDPLGPDGQPRLDRAWVLDLLETLAAFPAVAHDDEVDALTQALVQLRKGHDAWAEWVRSQAPAAPDTAPV